MCKLNEYVHKSFLICTTSQQLSQNYLEVIFKINVNITTKSNTCKPMSKAIDHVLYFESTSGYLDTIDVPTYSPK